MSSPYYRPSGQAPMRGKCTVALFAAGTLPMAWLYGWATSWANPLLNPFIAVLMASCLAMLVKGAAAAGKIRHPRWMGRAGATVGLLAWYLQWAIWLAHREQVSLQPYAPGALAESVVQLTTHPWEMLAAGRRIVTNSTALAASVSLLFWVVELGLYLLPPAFAGAARSRAPFCEATQRWARMVDVGVQFAFVAHPEEVRRRLERNPKELVSVLVPCAHDAPMHAELTLYQCPGADSFATLTNWIMAPSGGEEQRDMARMLAKQPDEIEVVFQADDPVVELLRLPIPDTDTLIREWKQAALRLSANTME